MCESPFCHPYDGVSHISLRNLWDSVCVAFCKNVYSFPKVRKYCWDSQSIFPSEGPITPNGEGTSWWLWVFPKSTMLKSISSWAPGRQESLNGDISAGLILNLSCVHSWTCLELLDYACSIHTLLSVFNMVNRAYFNLLLFVTQKYLSTSIISIHRCLLNVESWALTYTSWIRIQILAQLPDDLKCIKVWGTLALEHKLISIQLCNSFIIKVMTLHLLCADTVLDAGVTLLNTPNSRENVYLKSFWDEAHYRLTRSVSDWPQTNLCGRI